MWITNIVTSVHQAKTMTLNYFLEAKNKNIKRNKLRVKGNEWDWKQLHS
jgi:hypothetical protein